MPDLAQKPLPEQERPPEQIVNPETAPLKEGEALRGPDFAAEKTKPGFGERAAPVISEALRVQEPPTIKETLGRIGREEILFAQTVVDNPKRHTEWELQQALELLASKEARDLSETKLNE